VIVVDERRKEKIGDDDFGGDGEIGCEIKMLGDISSSNVFFGDTSSSSSSWGYKKKKEFGYKKKKEFCCYPRMLENEKTCHVWKIDMNERNVNFYLGVLRLFRKAQCRWNFQSGRKLR